MKRYIEGVDRSQGTLLPEQLDDWVHAHEAPAERACGDGAARARLQHDPGHEHHRLQGIGGGDAGVSASAFS